MTTTLGRRAASRSKREDGGYANVEDQSNPYRPKRIALDLRGLKTKAEN
jgi:hypothetical protein